MGSLANLANMVLCEVCEVCYVKWTSDEANFGPVGNWGSGKFQGLKKSRKSRKAAGPTSFYPHLDEVFRLFGVEIILLAQNECATSAPNGFVDMVPQASPD